MLSTPSAAQLQNYRAHAAALTAIVLTQEAGAAADWPVKPVELEPQVGKFCEGRGDDLHEGGMETSPIAEVTAVRPGDCSAGWHARHLTSPHPLIGDPAPSGYSGRTCQHGVRGYYCKACPGKGICEHQRHKDDCKDCRAARGLGPRKKARCECGRIKEHCQKCGGAQLCEHGHQRYACRRGLCPERRLAAAAGRGYYAEEEVIAALTLAPPAGKRLRARGGELVRWPMGFPTCKDLIEREMRLRSSVLMRDWPHE